MRSTCLYCEQDGKVQPLIKFGHWGCCPVHSKSFVEASTPPTVRQMIETQIGPYLSDKGAPTINGVKVERSTG